MPNPKDFLTTQQFAQQAGMSASTVSKWLRSGKINGEKQSGKWMIPADELGRIASASKSKTTPAQPPAAAKADSKPVGVKSSGQSYSLEEFSALTYLTPFGVEKWLKQGRLKGSRDSSGQWRIDKSNLEIDDVRRLVRE